MYPEYVTLIYTHLTSNVIFKSTFMCANDMKYFIINYYL